MTSQDGTKNDAGMVEIEQLWWMYADELCVDLEQNPDKCIPSLPGVINDLLTENK